MAHSISLEARGPAGCLVLMLFDEVPDKTVWMMCDGSDGTLAGCWDARGGGLRQYGV